MNDWVKKGASSIPSRLIRPSIHSVALVSDHQDRWAPCRSPYWCCSCSFNSSYHSFIQSYTQRAYIAPLLDVPQRRSHPNSCYKEELSDACKGFKQSSLSFFPRTLSVSFFSHLRIVLFSRTGVPLSSFFEGALYKCSIWMNEWKRARRSEGSLT